jgi:hypothetical protein
VFVLLKLLVSPEVNQVTAEATGRRPMWFATGVSSSAGRLNNHLRSAVALLGTGSIYEA